MTGASVDGHVTWAAIKTKQLGEQRAHVLDALKTNGWGLKATAKHLGVNPSTLHRLIRRLGLWFHYTEHSLPPGPRPRKATETEGQQT